MQGIFEANTKLTLQQSERINDLCRILRDQLGTLDNPQLQKARPIAEMAESILLNLTVVFFFLPTLHLKMLNNIGINYLPSYLPVVCIGTIYLWYNTFYAFVFFPMIAFVVSAKYLTENPESISKEKDIICEDEVENKPSCGSSNSEQNTE